MPTTAPSGVDRIPLLSRRGWLTGAFGVAGPALLFGVPADGKDSPLARLAALASALTAGDPVAALNCFSPATPEYGRIESYIGALTAQTEVSCAIETVTESDGDAPRKLETDWLMQLVARTDPTVNERRRVRVTIQMQLEKNQWRISAFSPLSILFPINLR